LFNLIVKGQAWAAGQDTFPAQRIFEHTDEGLSEKFHPKGGALNLRSLIELPTLFVEESYGQQDQLARVGIILRAHMSGRDVGLEYVYEPSVPPIPNRQLQALSAALGIGAGEFTRTHWAVKETDLFRVLFTNLQPQRNKPTAFQVADPPAIERELASAMMPFHPSFDPVYAKIREVTEAVGLRCRRADDIWENPAIIQDIVSLIDRSRVVICDCTGRNPNVFYEAGIAHTLGRDVILITQSSEDIPFDLRHLRYIQYLNNGEGRAQMATRLTQRLESLG